MYIHIIHTHAHIYEMYVSMSTRLPVTAHTSCLGQRTTFSPSTLAVPEIKWVGKLV